MYRKLNSNFLLFSIFTSLLLILGYFLGSYLWNFIFLELKNPANVVGKLTLNNYNPLNNTLRFLTFISIPSIILLIIHFLSKKEPDLIVIEDNKFQKFSKLNYFVLIFLLLVILLNFFTKDFSTDYFDSFHEGVELSPAFNFSENGGLWSKTLFVRGVFNDVLTAYWSWEIFGVQSIGSYRIFVDILKLFIPASLILLLYSIWKKFQFNFLGAFTVQNIILFYLITSPIHYFERRVVPLLIGISLLTLAKSNKNKLLFFISGLFGAVGLFYSVDIGIFLFALYVIYPVILYILKSFQFKEFLARDIFLFIGLTVGYTIFYFSFSSIEQKAFISNLTYLIKYKDLLDSQIYPLPNFTDNLRATIPLVLTSFNVLVLLYFYLNFYSKKYLLNQGFIHFILTAISVIFYRGALGRADLTHIEYSSTFIFLTLGFNFSIFVNHFLKNKRLLQLFFYILIGINFSLITHKYLSGVKLSNLLNFNERLVNFINLPDEKFYNQKNIEGIKEITELVREEKCIVSLASDAVSPYMFKKPSCNEFYISYFSAIDPLREKFINDLEEIKPKYIIYSTNSWTQNLDNISNNQRFPEVIEYVNQKYTFYKTYSDNWNVYIRN